MSRGWILPLGALALLCGACKPLPPEEIPEEAADELLTQQEADRLRALRRARESINQNGGGNTLGFDDARQMSRTFGLKEEDIHEAQTLLRAIAEDPSLLGDKERLTNLASQEGFDADTKVMEWDPNKRRVPGDPQSEEANELVRNGWAIQRIGYDPEKNVLLLYWFRLRRESMQPAPFNQ